MLTNPHTTLPSIDEDGYAIPTVTGFAQRGPSRNTPVKNGVQSTDVLPEYVNASVVEKCQKGSTRRKTEEGII